MCDQFYNLPSTKSPRAAGFGYGERVLLNSSNQGVGPTKYTLPDQFKANKGKGFTLGAKLPTHLQGNTVVPGPGNYALPSTLSKQGSRIVLSKGATKDQTSSSMPGPGSYDVRTKTEGGKYVLSNFKTDRQAKIFQGRQERSLVDNYHREVPGPGKYSPRLDCISRFRQVRNVAFGKQDRSRGNRTDRMPGPGSYSIPSIFLHR